MVLFRCRPMVGREILVLATKVRFLPPELCCPIGQLVGQLPLKQFILGSNPSGVA